MFEVIDFIDHPPLSAAMTTTTSAEAPDDPKTDLAEIATVGKVLSTINNNNSNRVTMKIDVSYTDHSHVIGKGGQSIKGIMTETQCHIHFPDSNRTNTIEKSNQVSISGLSYGVELARQKIRSILPLIYSFDIPFAPYTTLEQQDRALVTQLQRLFEVTISYRPMGKMVNGTTVFVKGIIQRSRQTIKAVNIILSHHFGHNIDQVPVMMTIEIDPKHHSFLLNQGGPNNLVHEIYQLTRATINFPDNTFSSVHALLAATNPMGISGLFKKSTVTIWGTAENTFEARQQLIGRLPVILMYDISIEEGVNLEMFNLNVINEKFDVSISIKLKLKQSTKSVIIRTTERNVQALFEVKNILNKLRSQYKPIIQAGLKSSMVSIPYSKNVNISTTRTESIFPGMALLHNIGVNSISTVKMDRELDIKQNNNATIPNSFTTSHIPLIPNNGTIVHTNHLNVTKTVQSVNLHDFMKINSNVLQISQQENKKEESLSLLSSISNQMNCGLFGSSISSSTSSGVESESDSNVLSRSNLQTQKRTLNQDISDWRAPGAEYSAKQRELKRSINSSPVMSMSDLTRQFPMLTLGRIPELIKEEKTVTKEFHQRDFKENICNYFDSKEQYEGKSRMNNDNDNMIMNEKDMLNKTHDITETTHIPKWNNVVKILLSLDLGRFVDNFIRNEIDFNTFCSLTENDLKELGVNTFGARRKLILAINDVKQQQ